MTEPTVPQQQPETRINPTPKTPETGTTGALPETAVAEPPAPTPRPPIQNLDDLVDVLQEGRFSPLFVATCAAVAGALVPRGCRADAGTTETEELYIQWAIRTSVEAAFLTESAAVELKEALAEGNLPPWVTLKHWGTSLPTAPVG